MTETLPAQVVLEQIEALCAYYQEYCKECARIERETSGIKRLGQWFSPASRFSNDSMHTKFYEGVQARVDELDRALAALSDSGQRAEAAQQAISVILHPIPESERDVAGWMRFAAEPLCLPLLTYLPPDTLRELYEQYNRVYPKRLQFPAQVKLRKEMERLLKRETDGMCHS